MRVSLCSFCHESSNPHPPKRRSLSHSYTLTLSKPLPLRSFFFFLTISGSPAAKTLPSERSFSLSPQPAAAFSTSPCSLVFEGEMCCSVGFARSLGLALLPLALCCIVANLLLLFPMGETTYIEQDHLSRYIWYFGGLGGGGLLVSKMSIGTTFRFNWKIKFKKRLD